MGVSIRASKPPLRRERAATTRVASTSRAILARLLQQNRHDSEAFGTAKFAAALWGLADSCHSVMCDSRLWRDTQSPTCTGSSHRYRGVPVLVFDDSQRDDAAVEQGAANHHQLARKRPDGGAFP